MRILRNYLRLGPIHIKVSNKYLANWGYPLLKIGGAEFWSRSNDGRRMLAAYHPRSSLTWLWALYVYRGKAMGPTNWKHRGTRDFGLFGWVLHYSWQQRMPVRPPSAEV
ncbi:hypothetical protein [Tardiphaga sp.]|uniref:hypothetical protein n=1 Tax=Tardiphaga sp. TaxID=1926292 RepID=UPI0037D9BDAB